MPSAPAPPSPAPAPLTQDQLAHLAAASPSLRKARRASGVARFSGWTLAIFAVLTALGGLTDPISLGTAAALAVLAWSELHGARAVRALDPTASRRLVINQFALLALIVLYAGLNIWRALHAPAPAGLEPTGDRQIDAMLRDFADLSRMISIGVYAALLLIGAPVQLAMAGYHALRGQQLRACLAQTPPWIVQVARAA